MAGGGFLRGLFAGALITLGFGAGAGLVAMMARDYWEQEQRARAAEALEPDRPSSSSSSSGVPGDLLSELAAAQRAEAARASPSPAVPVASAESVATPEVLAGQSETKRNQMLVVDLYLQILGRYPNAKEQKAWFDPATPLHQQLRSLRLVGEEDVGVANFIAGTLMEAPAYRQRFPAPPEALVSAFAGGDGAQVVGALFARVVGYLPETKGEDATLVRSLQARFGLAAPQGTQVKAMTALLRAASDSTDVGEHWLEAGAPLALELDAIRTSLRSGRVVVARSPGARWVLIAGFDSKGTFLVRDPRGEMTERTEAEQLVAFLRGAADGVDGGAAGAVDGGTGTVVRPGGVWLDVPSRPRRAPCPPPMLASLGSLPGTGPIPSDQRLPGYTGVIQGAQVNLTQLRVPPGQHTMRGTMSATAEQIDQVLAAAHSPAAGSGKAFVRWGQYYNLDPVYALAFFKHESWFGTHPRWVGQMGGGKTTRNIGNIRYFSAPDPEREPQYGSFNGFRTYGTWEDGIKDWFKLLAFDAHYAGLHTVEAVLPIYAPASENDTALYLRDVGHFVEEWRSQVAAPLQPAPAVVTADGDCR